VFRELVRPDPLRVKPPLGESFAEQIERLRGFLDEIARRHPAGRVLIVSHEDPILAALAAAGRDPEDAARGRIANCQAVELSWQAPCQ
jgi:broad specificity phosphatase PhoE